MPPFFIPMIVGVLGGVICYQIYLKFQQRSAIKRQHPLTQMTEKRLQARKLYSGHEALLFVGEDDEITAIGA
jgi:hypothetical protein